MNSTNTIQVMADNLENATLMAYPLTLGIIGALVVLAVINRTGKKAGINDD